MGELSAGTRIGQYTIDKPLGAGGMGAVYLARHVTSGEPFALKVMHAEAATSDQARRRFVREAKVTMALDHPNVVRILACFEHEGLPVIVMEYLRGRSLTDSLEKSPRQQLARVAGIFVRVTSAIGTAHAMGLIHRDLKPDNIFLLDEEPFVKILDFGIAKMRKGFGLEESSALTRTGMLVGTPYYMSPEQAFGEKDIDHRADIWSLGLILYETLLGVLPTRADTLQEVLRRLMTMDFERLDEENPAIPKDVADLVQSMLSRDREGRPSDLRDVYRVLAEYAGDLSAAPQSFAAAASPVLIDEMSSAALSGAVPAAGVSPNAQTQTPAEPLKLTPNSLKRSSGPATPEGTLLLDPAPNRAAPAARPPAGGRTEHMAPAFTKAAKPSPAKTVADAPLDVPSTPAAAPLPVTVAEPQKKSALWMWIVAGLLVAACVVVLVTQLR